MEKFIQTGNTEFTYRNDLDKACFQHDLPHGKSKDLTRRTQSDKVLRDKAFEIASNQKYDFYQKESASMIYKFFDKKYSGNGVAMLANKFCANLQMNFISRSLKKFKKIKVCSSFKDNISGVYLADMQSRSKYNRGIRYLLCSIDLFSKYAWVIPLKDKRRVTIVNAFQKIVDSWKEFHSKSSVAKSKIQMKYELIKVVNFTIFIWKDFWK